MARTLEIKYDGVTRDPETDAILIDANGTGDNPISLPIVVDGINDNASFTMYSLNGDWFDYETERVCDSVYILIKVRRNLSTDVRLGTLVVEHNCSENQKEYIELVQNGIEYSLTAELNNGWVFKSVPDEVYEEKSITLNAVNGREKWYLKEIQQYQVLSTDNFDDIKKQYDESYDGQLSQIRVPYDGVFNHRIDGNKLIIKSFGQIDSSLTDEGHMRYFFVFCHMDVNNTNKDMLDDKGIVYEQKKLFVFDRNDISGYEE